MALKGNVIVNGREIKALIDTGAAGNIITNKLRKRLGIRIEKPSRTMFMIANGKKIPSLGETEITIEIEEEIEIPIKVQIIDSVKEDLLLGTEFLKETGGIINFRNGKLSLEYDGEQIGIPMNYIKKGESEVKVQSQNGKNWKKKNQKKVIKNNMKKWKMN